ncbi:HMG box protein [Aspergillus sclerotiicarbonarius CBS 121057]|uniref:HMG box protein n=1 Tax=Aspergillus sclerotiicarbonarius (strain CBS 121057 / IBT 28362) TaxID=1448318 RepID=A0A319FP22_ASPSB|nr:HMG box protein [Aspergillus sclerotiicarbonarius CBS 121057]
MATAATARFIRGPPPSPPHSTDGDPTSDAHRNSCGILQPVYSHHDAYAASALHGNHAPGEDYTSSSSQYVSSGDYPRALSMQNPMAANGLQVNTPPPAADEGLAPDSVSRWNSPPTHKQVARARVARSPRVRRRKNRKETKIQLNGPLSEITKHLTHIPIGDMESLVNRPIEERHKAVAEKNGKVARPMNSFMLYRSAYAARIKHLFGQNNHQVVSEAAGNSWRLEPREIREKYELLASIEKSNHLKAHPGYKFSPSKDKKKRPGSEDERPLANTPGSSPALLQTRAMSSSEVGSSGWESREITPFDFADHGLLPSDSYLPSWHATNHGRSHSGMIPSSEPSHYLQQTINAALMPHVEDVRFKKPGLHGIQYATSSTPLAALPGATHHDLLQPSTSMPGDGQLDPQLLTLQTELQSPSQLFGGSHYLWQESPTNCYPPATSSLAPNSVPYPAGTYPPGLHSLETDPALDGPTGEFDTWINQGTAY